MHNDEVIFDNAALAFSDWNETLDELFDSMITEDIIEMFGDIE